MYVWAGVINGGSWHYTCLDFYHLINYLTIILYVADIVVRPGPVHFVIDSQHPSTATPLTPITTRNCYTVECSA